MSNTYTPGETFFIGKTEFRVVTATEIPATYWADHERAWAVGHHDPHPRGWVSYADPPRHWPLKHSQGLLRAKDGPEFHAYSFIIPASYLKTKNEYGEVAP